MSKNVLRPARASVGRALVFICQKCGKRVGNSTRDASYELAENLKHAAKREFGKGEVRVVLTACMDICPEESISVLLQPADASEEPALLQADAHDPDASSKALLQRLRETGTDRSDV